MSDELKSAENRVDQKENGFEDSSSSYEINIIEQLKKLWAERRIILIITGAFTIFGLFHYQFGPTEYQSVAKLIQETDSGGGGGSGAELLRSLTGVNLGAGSAVTATARGYSPPPLFLYPEIVGSTGFQKELIYREIEFSTYDTTMTLFDYFTEFEEPPFRDQVYSFIADFTIKLPFTIYKGLRWVLQSVDGEEGEEEVLEEEDELDGRLLEVTPEEMSVIAKMRTLISLTINPGITEVAVRLPDPKAAALVNAMLIEHIQEYMIDYRVEKARQNLEFIQDQQQDAYERYEEAQMELARFQDQNLNLNTALARTEVEHLQEQRNLAYNVYSSVSGQVEQARLTLQQQTPVFNILEKPDVPTTQFTGASNVILVFSVIFGFFVGIAWVYIRDFYQSYRARKSGLSEV